jgi:hypothetical protein
MSMSISDLPHPPGTETMRFHRWQFLAERVGWCVMFAVLVFALLGGFGRGWLSSATGANDDESLKVEYERFGREHASCELCVRAGAALAGDELRLHFNREFIENVRVEKFTPQFESTEANGEGVTFAFKLESGSGDRLIELRYQPEKVGPLWCRIKADDSEEVELNQFIYP